MKPFKSDGCSMWPDGNYGSCCYDHDKAYWCGGSWRDRLAADNRLFGCVYWMVSQKYNSTAIAILWATAMWAGVRIGGVPYWPVPWRWGFGHRWPRCKP